MSNKKKKRRLTKMKPATLIQKANTVLNIILLAFVLFAIRAWYLSILKHNDYVEQAKHPQQRVVIERAERGTICDRFEHPLAINKVQYNASVLYAQILEVPRVTWEKDRGGKRVKVFFRKKHITQLSQVLSEELNMEADRIEDLIYAHAAVFPNTSFPIKENIDEKTYFRLKMLEKEWLGLHTEIVPRRNYPQEKVAADAVGYLGAINREEYHAFMDEMRQLRKLFEEEDFIPSSTNYEELKQRFQELKEKSYGINDSLGKIGVEKVFEEELRGFFGKKTYFSDAKGNYLRELPGSQPAIPGLRLSLTISSELQSFAELLLAQNERIRDGTSSRYDKKTGRRELLKQPWIKGGAIVVMDPNNGDIIALASHPRYNPNDFISSGNQEIDREKQRRILQWLETDKNVANIWDRISLLERETADPFSKVSFEEAIPLTWNAYLKMILPSDSPVIDALRKIKTIENAIVLQQTFEKLLSITEAASAWSLIDVLYRGTENERIDNEFLGDDEKIRLMDFFKENDAQVSFLIATLDQYLHPLSLNYEKLLVIDLCRLAVDAEAFSSELLALVGQQSLFFYREASVSCGIVNSFVKEKTKGLFHDYHFAKWRQENEKKFLKQKRAEEKEKKTYARPYIYYLDEEEKKQFREFWNSYRWELLTLFLMGEARFSDFSDEQMQPYQEYFLEWYKEIEAGAHHSTSWKVHYATLQRSLKELGPAMTLHYFKTMRSFKDLNRPLLGRYRNVKTTNGTQTEHDLAAAFYPKYGFGYGRSYCYRQATTLGSIFKIVTAYTALLQRYFELGESVVNEDQLNPMTIIDRVKRKDKNSPWIVGYTVTGEPIPQLYKGGRILKSLDRNIGNVDMIHALERSSNTYFSLLAADYLHDPNALNLAAKSFGFGEPTRIQLPGEYSGFLPKDLLSNRSGLYSYSCGQHTLTVTPLQTAVMLSAIANGGMILQPNIVKSLSGRQPARKDKQIIPRSHFSFKESLNAVGVNFPLFSAAETRREKKTQMRDVKPEIKSSVLLPVEIRNYLLKGMHQIAIGKYEGTFRNYFDYPQFIRDYNRFKFDIAGKTSTAESRERVDIDYFKGSNIYNHLWFGAISFNHSANNDLSFSNPELVVVVYLPYGSYGKEAAPLVTQIIKKWRDIKRKEQNG